MALPLQVENLITGAPDRTCPFPLLEPTSDLDFTEGALTVSRPLILLGASAALFHFDGAGWSQAAPAEISRAAGGPFDAPPDRSAFSSCSRSALGARGSQCGSG